MKTLLHRSRPQSFIALLVTSGVLVALPLLAAVAYSAWNTERLVEQSRSAMFSAAQAARLSRSLVNRVLSFERLAQRILESPAPEWQADLERVHHSFKQVAGDLAALPLEVEPRGVLYRTVAQEQALFEHISARSKSATDRHEVSQQVSDLADSAAEVLAISSLAADRESERLRASADTVRLHLAYMAALATGLMLLVSVALARHLARPVAQLDAAIRRLGDSDLQAAIEVQGPRSLRTLGERLEWLRRRLLELEGQKNRFLRHLSHELKTPLTALREGAELLHEQAAGPLAPAQRQVVTIMRDNSLRLQRMIEALLDYQRAVHATETLTFARVQLDAFVRDCAHAHALPIRNARQRLTLALQPVEVVADATKLRAIVDNLLGNAAKYTPAGGTIHVRVRLVDDEALIDIEDSGPGIPASEREAIFESFFRGGDEHTARAPGTGLGLAIAREYAAAHGGRIALVGGGTGAHFRVRLPRARPGPTLARAA